MTPAQRQKKTEMKRSKSIIRRYIAPILFAIAFVGGKGAFLGEGVFMCPHVELGLCCKNFEVVDDHKLGKDCRGASVTRIGGMAAFKCEDETLHGTRACCHWERTMKMVCAL